jgi:protein-disulfide isomerase
MHVLHERPACHLSKDALDQLYVRFHEELYADTFLKSASSEVAKEAALILKSASNRKGTDSGMIVVGEDSPR